MRENPEEHVVCSCAHAYLGTCDAHTYTRAHIHKCTHVHASPYEEKMGAHREHELVGGVVANAEDEIDAARVRVEERDDVVDHDTLVDPLRSDLQITLTHLDNDRKLGEHPLGTGGGAVEWKRRIEPCIQKNMGTAWGVTRG